MKKEFKKAISVLLVICLVFPMLTAIAIASDSLPNNESVIASSDTDAAEDTVANAVYQSETGVVTAKTVMTTVYQEDMAAVSIEVVTTEGIKTYTTEEMSLEQAEDIKSSIKPKGFVEICKDDKGNVITFKKLFNIDSRANVFFDAAKYGPELSPVGGKAGNMVAAGWVLAKADNSITIGDIHRFKETYAVSQDVKVYNVNTENYYSSKSSNFEEIPITAPVDGELYKATSRQQVYVVFNQNYEKADEAEVVEIYYLTPQYTINQDKIVKPDIMPSGSFLSGIEGKTFGKPNQYPFYTGTEPFEIIKDKMYYVGDNEVAVYLFNTEKGLVLLDAGWPDSGYQYWKNIEEVGFNPRDIKYVLLTHGHADHYGTAVELDIMIKNAGRDPVIYETYEDIYGYDIYGYSDIKGIITDKALLAAVDKTYIYDEWMDFGGVRIYPTNTPGHTIGTCSFIFEVTHEGGEVIRFAYMGGYGVNGLTDMPMNGDFKRLAFQHGLQWLQQNVETDYVAPQHTNQYPFLETYKAAKEKNITFMEALAKGNEEWINFCEKRYQVITNELLNSTLNSSKYKTIEKYGPFKRKSGEYKVTLLDDGKIIHGFDKYQNKNEALNGIINYKDEDMGEGIVINTDSYVHDPEGWYIQFSVKVDDDYNGTIPSGPVEAIRENWSEVIRTARLNSKADAEALMAKVRKGETYMVTMNQASQIELAENLLDTFREVIDDTTVDHTVYGWALGDAIKNDDGSVSITIREVPSFEEKTYTTSISLDDAEHTNTVTGITRADALSDGDVLKKDAFVEIQFNAANECIDIEVIEFSEVAYMDSASYGGELTAKGGGAGNMVATGWILDKDEIAKTITIGDGNHVTNVFEETYTLADNCKIYVVNNSTTDGTKSISGLNPKYNVPGNWNLIKEGNFDDIVVTEKDETGEIYYVPERYTTVCIFDSNYKTSWKDGSAKVKELYLFANPIVLSKKDMATPDGMQYDGTSWYPAKSKLEEKTGFSYNGSCEPIEIMKNRLYDVGDAYTDIYLFVGGDGTLSLLDQGNRTASYQYWLNIEKIGYDPRDVDNILLTHGHGDHYQALYENCLMIRRAGGKVDAYINPYSQGATVSNDKVSYELEATLTNNPVLYSVNYVIDWDKWLDFMGDGISIYPWRSIGHSNDTASFIFKLTATDNDAYFETGDVVSWIYFGGYGARTSLSQGANRLQIVYSMMYEQSVITPWAQAQSHYVYPLAQHTNQYPQHEIYKAAKISGIPYTQALTEGAECISNFMEKRISVGFYEWMDQAYRNRIDEFGNIIEPKTGFRCDSSGKTFFDTIQAHGPFKRPDGEYTIEIKGVTVIHGYDAFQNKGVNEFADQTNIYGFTLDKGFVIDKDSYTHDPNGWYVQVICRVNDDYEGGVDYETNFYKGNYTSGVNDEPYTKAWPGGPVEMAVNSDSWVEILRTERFDTQAEAEAYAKALTNNGYAIPYQTYNVDGSELYVYGDTSNYPNPITVISASGSSSYKVNLSKASEILLGSGFEDTFRKESYVVNFVGGPNTNGDAPETIFVKKDDLSKNISLPKNTFIKSGYHFIGWSDGSATYQPGETYEVTKDTVFTAVWTRKSSGSGGSGSSSGGTIKPEELAEIEPVELEPEDMQKENISFADIDRHWAREAIQFVVERKLFNGISETIFSPDTSMTRGMFATVLGRLAKANADEFKSQFLDVDNDAWFAGSIAWAAENGIVKGVGNNKFAPDMPITREQLCVMIIRYADFADLKLTDKVIETSFADSDSISIWAADAVSTAQRAGLIKGRDENKFDPQNAVTRAEVAVILQRLIENFID